MRAVNRGTESPAHATLKRLALDWARRQGFGIVATEVSVPKSGFRADVAGYKRGRHGTIGATAVFECKQARSDFLKDSYVREPVIAQLRKLDERRATLERLLKLHMPSLRRGETLFAEFDAVDLRGFEHKGYRGVLREIGRLQRRLYGKTKFEKLVRYRCANLNYLVVEAGIVAPHEMPVGFGLLARRGDELVLERAPVWQEVGDAGRLVLLERIAAAASRHLPSGF